MPLIRCYLMHRPNRKIECQWRDPVTGKLKTKSTGTTKPRDAERFLARLEDELNNGEAHGVDTLWATVADRYQAEVLVSRAPATLRKFQGTRNAVEDLIDPKLVASLTTATIAKFTNGLRARGLAALTIKGHLQYLRTCLRWANRAGLLRSVPAFEMPRRVNKMKGRPITAEEFERMLSALPVIFPPSLIPEWEFLLRGLWLSGLRIGEALKLTWDPSGFCVNLAGKVPRLKIEVNEQKSAKAELLPLAPDFAEFLLAVPTSRRHGRVFRQSLDPDSVAPMRLDTTSNKIQEIGRAARVLVEEKPPKLPGGKPRKKYASAHDFRRAFGQRWAKIVRPQELKALMRHASIVTSETFYNESKAEDVEIAISRSLSQHNQPAPNTSANTEPIAETNNSPNP